MIFKVSSNTYWSMMLFYDFMVISAPAVQHLVVAMVLLDLKIE